MRRRSLAAVMIAALVLSLTGCLRENSNYYIQSDGKVSGSIYTALKEGYQDDSKPYHGTDAGTIAAYFQNATITEEISAPWYGYVVTFTNEPLSTFSAVPQEAWQIQIAKSGNTYNVTGYDTNQIDGNTRNSISSNGGWVYLHINFPGAVTDVGNASYTGTTSGSGWVKWDMMSVTGAPHASGSGGIILLYPGVFQLNPISPMATPAVIPTAQPTAPAPQPAAPAPQPVVTVVTTPSPSASPSASPSPSVSAVAVGTTGGSSGIPAWIWIAMAAMAVGLAGLGGFMVATRGRVPAPVVAGGPEGEAASAEPGPVEPDGHADSEGTED